MANRRLAITIQLSGARETLRAFSGLPKEASTELREAALDISTDMADRIAAAALADSKQSALMASTVKPVKDRVPAVSVGGSKRVTTGKGRRVAAYLILFGANFGAVRYTVPGKVPLFRAHTGRGQDYFIYRTVMEHEDEIDRRWGEAADATLERWAHGGMDPHVDAGGKFQ